MLSDAAVGDRGYFYPESSSDDELLPRALPIDDYGKTDPPDASKILLCPNEYLRHVRLEASKLPETLVSSIHTLDKDEVGVPEAVSSRSSFRDFSEAWKHAQAYKFQKSQKEFSYLVKQFLPSKSFPSDADSLISSLRSDDCIHWLVNHPPMLSYFVELSQANVSLLLETLLSACPRVGWNSALQPWVYGGLLGLEPPLLPGTCHTVRRIGKKFCKYLRESEQQKGDDSRDRRFCFIIISVVAFAFGQRDLLEDI
ncbi:survival of motor neuron protein interacting [Echinococcus multilocularis]|uniref:Gem-associated protein 2 n=1 Tax=Echinococcus multilocularis TaxID=6211 RepID=A0A068YFS2_ECHMU|nr:survival of motor neuron protein interacting [Echinococcus multilocularis]